MKTVTIEGQQRGVGDFVGFKSDIEMTGRIEEVHANGATLTVSVYDSVTGERSPVTVPTARCWPE